MSFDNSADMQRANLNIGAFGISLTTMEEIFLKIGLEDNNSASLDTAQTAVTVKDTHDSTAIKSRSGEFSFFQQLRALLVSFLCQCRSQQKSKAALLSNFYFSQLVGQQKLGRKLVPFHFVAPIHRVSFRGLNPVAPF